MAALRPQVYFVFVVAALGPQVDLVFVAAALGPQVVATAKVIAVAIVTAKALRPTVTVAV